MSSAEDFAFLLQSY